MRVDRKVVVETWCGSSARGKADNHADLGEKALGTQVHSTVQGAAGGILLDNNMGRTHAFANADTASSLNSHDLLKSQLTPPILPEEH